MEVAYAFFAEAVTQSSDGKLNILGADFNRIQGTFPLVHPHFAFVTKLVFSPEEWGKEYELAFEIVGPDGGKIEPGMPPLKMIPPAPSEDELKLESKTAAVMVLQMNGAQFRTPGKYLARVLVNGEEVKSQKLLLIESSQPLQTTLVPIGPAQLSQTGGP
jgi:hypothetical protein